MSSAGQKRTRGGVAQWVREEPAELRDLKGEPCCMGIDEAGRGPVLGPMVYGACFAPLGRDKDLRALGFADSKTLTEDRRDTLFEVIKKSDYIAWMVVSLSGAELSNKMCQRSKYNLNAISHDTAFEMIQRALDAGANIKECYIDTVGDADSYERKLRNMFPSIDFTVCKKADSIYPITSAASICAKVTRDVQIKEFKFREPTFTTKCDLGSGYPGDVHTKNWLAQNGDSVFGYPDLVRFSWQTTNTLLEQNAHAFKWEADEEDDDVGQSKLQFQVIEKPKDPKPKPSPNALSSIRTLPLPTPTCSFSQTRNLLPVVCLPR